VRACAFLLNGAWTILLHSDRFATAVSPSALPNGLISCLLGIESFPDRVDVIDGRWHYVVI